MNINPKQKEDDEEPIFAQEPVETKSEETIHALIYGQSPVSMKCPFCLQHIHSQIILKPQFISIALGISLFVIVPHLAMMVLVIMLMHFTASRKHRCPLCERQLGNDGKFLMYFTDEVYSLSLLSAGFIFTKKMLFTAVLLIFIIFVMSIRVAQLNNDKWVTTTWPEYHNQCSTGDYNSCFEKYRGKQFRNWEGHLLRLLDNRQNSHKYYLHALSLFMKMQPKIKQDNQPDVLLTLNSEAVYYNSEVLKNLQHGDLVRFNCTLHERYRGNLKDVKHFHIETLEIIGHDTNYALYTTQIEEEWIQVHVENRGRLTSQPDEIEANKTK